MGWRYDDAPNSGDVIAAFDPAINVGVWEFVQHAVNVGGVSSNRLRDLGHGQAVRISQQVSDKVLSKPHRALPPQAKTTRRPRT